MHILLLIGVQVLVLCQAREAKNLIYQADNVKYSSLLATHENYQKAQAFAKVLEEYDRNRLRSISDLWQSIKNSAKNVWEHIKNLANNAKEKIDVLLEKLKEKAEDLKEKFAERVKQLQEKMIELIEEALSANPAVKKCVQAEKESIDKITKEIISNVSTCISENIMHLSPLQRQIIMEKDEKEFMNEIEDSLTACINEDVDEECLYKVREKLFKDIDVLEQEALRSERETRSIVSDIFNTIISCSTEGLIAATADITKEAIKIVKCVSEGESVDRDFKIPRLVAQNIPQRLYLRM